MAVSKIKSKKIFVLDTSVILYNHNAINCFEENFVAIPITVLEELDNFKKGNDTLNFEAREFIRTLDSLSEKHLINEWIPLKSPVKGKFKVIMNETVPYEKDARQIFDDNKPDHRILNAAMAIGIENPDYKLILVSKDINLRLKAKSLNILAEDFETGKIKDLDSLYSGKAIYEHLDKELIDKIYQDGFCSPGELGIKSPIPNEYFCRKYFS